MTNTLYILESVNNSTFPYRLTIRQGDKVLLALKVQDRWHGQKGNIFWIRETIQDLDYPVGEIEKVQIINIIKALKDLEKKESLKNMVKAKRFNGKRYDDRA